MLIFLAKFFSVRVRRHLALLFGGFVVVVLGGAGAFSATQGIGYGSALYWAITTATTVGYGDLSPHNSSGRVVASLVMLTAIPLLGAIFAVVTGASVSAGIRRFMQMERHFPTGPYRLVVGNHQTIPAIVRELDAADVDVVVVGDLDATVVPSDVHVIHGSPTDPAVVARGRPAGADHILVTATNDGDVLVSAVLLRRAAPDVPMTALTNSNSVRDALEALGVQQTLSVDGMVAHTLAKSLETPHAGPLVEQLMDSDDHALIEIDAEPAAFGKVLSAIRRDHEGLVLAIVRDGKVDLGIGTDPVLALGDRLLLATQRAGAG